MRTERPSVTAENVYCQLCGNVTTHYLMLIEKIEGVLIKQWCEICKKITNWKQEGAK